MGDAFQFLAQQRLQSGDLPPPNHACGCTLWLTGLSGAGKTSIASYVRDFLKVHRVPAYMLDGDIIRQGLSADLGFSDSDRTENVRRISEVSRLLADSGVITIAAFISPFEKDRAFARELHQVADLKFYEIYVDTPLEECIKRDTKGLYARALKGEIKGLTGIDAPYETPEHPELTLSTIEQTVDETGFEVIRRLVADGIIKQSVVQEDKNSSSEDEQVIQESTTSSNKKTKQHKAKVKRKGKKKKDRR